MAIGFSESVRNGMLNSIETTIGTSPKLVIRSGTIPANCAAASTGDLLVTMDLPSDWMGNAASGSKSMAGTWEDTSADGTGTAGYYRILDSAGTTCHLQGTVTTNGNGGDMTVETSSIVTGQIVRVTSFTITAPNA